MINLAAQRFPVTFCYIYYITSGAVFVIVVVMDSGAQDALVLFCVNYYVDVGVIVVV